MNIPAGLLQSQKMLAHDESEPFTPVRMLDIELTRPLPSVPYDGRHRRLCVLGRLHMEPVGVCIVSISPEGLTSVSLLRRYGPDFASRSQSASLQRGFPCPDSSAVTV